MTPATSTHRPGAVSAFFIYKAAFFAAGFWAWLLVLAIRGGTVSGWHVVAATGAMTTTLVGALLGVRFALQRDAAARHGEIVADLVELSWHAFAASPPPIEDEPTSGPARGGSAGVIRLAPDPRQHPRH